MVGVDFKIKLLENFDNTKKNIKLTIWDTAGQERFRSLTSSYYRGAQGVILVYDVSSRESFDNLKTTWLKELAVYADLDDLVLMIVGNKVDLEAKGERKVSTEEGLQLAKELSALFMESSAKTRLGIKSIFEELVRKILNSPRTMKIQEKKETSAAATVTLKTDEDEDVEPTTCAC
jgi:Ras-related protein Rab-18